MHTDTRQGPSSAIEELGAWISHTPAPGNMAYPCVMGKRSVSDQNLGVLHWVPPRNCLAKR